MCNLIKKKERKKEHLEPALNVYHALYTDCPLCLLCEHSCFSGEKAEAVVCDLGASWYKAEM